LSSGFDVGCGCDFCFVWSCEGAGVSPVNFSLDVRGFVFLFYWGWGVQCGFFVRENFVVGGGGWRG